MKIVNKDLVNPISGKGIEEAGKVITLFTAVATILSFTKTNNPLLSYKLSIDLTKAKKEVDFTIEEIAHINSVLNTTDNYLPMIVGQVLDCLK